MATRFYARFIDVQHPMYTASGSEDRRGLSM